MAHCASDCWDAEFLPSYSQIECVGIVGRSALFDLTVYSRGTGEPLAIKAPLLEPQKISE